MKANAIQVSSEAPADAVVTPFPVVRRTGAQTWLTGVYREHFAAVRALVRRKYGPGPPEPDDVTQQAFMRLAGLDAATREAITQPRAFLARMAENLLLDEKRKLAVRARHAVEVLATELPDQAFEASVEQALVAKEELGLIEQTIRAMPERRRQCFLLHRFEELSLAEIGRRLRISPTAARYHIVQAMADIEEAVHGA